jgi:hypothetical protein
MGSLALVSNLFLALVLLSHTCQASNFNDHSAPHCDESDTLVIEAALDHELEADRALRSDRVLVLYEEASRPNLTIGARPHFGQDLQNRLTKRNQANSKIPALRPKARVRFVSSTERANLFSEVHDGDVWAKFYSLFPNAGSLVNVSLPAFSPNKRVSIIYLERKSGPLAASGVLKQLSCRRGSWRVVRSQVLWAM